MNYAVIGIVILILSTILYSILNKNKKIKLVIFTDSLTVLALIAVFIILWVNLSYNNEAKVLTIWTYTLCAGVLINILVKLRMFLHNAKVS